jgi:hypothetical protein
MFLCIQGQRDHAKEVLLKAQSGHMPLPHPHATTAVLHAFSHDPNTTLFLFHHIPGNPPLSCTLLAIKAHAATGQWQYAAALLVRALGEMKGSCGVVQQLGPAAVAAVAESLKEAAVAATVGQGRVDILSVLQTSKEVRRMIMLFVLRQEVATTTSTATSVH